MVRAAGRSLRISFALMAATVAAGLVVRFAHLGLPTFVVKYGGSTMWALMIYWIVSTLLPLWPIVALALFGGVVATAVEFLKLCHWPALDAFRLTLPGMVLLGRFFSVWDIVAYWVAISAGAVVDCRLRRPMLNAMADRRV
jgi:hypothetical protein